MGHCLQSVVGVAHSSVCIVTMCTAAVMSQCVISCHRPTQHTRHIHMYMYYTQGGVKGAYEPSSSILDILIPLLALNQRHTGPWHASTRHSDHSLRCWLPGVLVYASKCFLRKTNSLSGSPVTGLSKIVLCLHALQ